VAATIAYMEEIMNSAPVLKRELDTFEAHKADFAKNAGAFVLIKDDEIEGTFDTYSDALKVGYDKFGVDVFLVKQISPAERILSFSRDFDFADD
jgi:hypothetical protein